MTGRGSRDARRDVTGPVEGLTHNPFAALRAARGDGAEEARDGAAETCGSAPTAGTPGADDPGAGLARRVVVRMERKGHGGRTVTRAERVGGDLEELARAARRELGAGARIDGPDLVVQGECVARLEAWLLARGVLEIVRGNR